MLDGPQIWRDSLQWEELMLRQEEEAESRTRFQKHDVPSREHRKVHVCPWMGCKRPLGYGEVEGIDGQRFHPGCAEAYREFENASKAADAAD